jgi:hypothetical protein
MCEMRALPDQTVTGPLNGTARFEALEVSENFMEMIIC